MLQNLGYRMKSIKLKWNTSNLSGRIQMQINYNWEKGNVKVISVINWAFDQNIYFTFTFFELHDILIVLNLYFSDIIFCKHFKILSYYFLSRKILPSLLAALFSQDCYFGWNWLLLHEPFLPLILKKSLKCQG